jgi:SAM-dependent methyltransferase
VANQNILPIRRFKTFMTTPTNARPDWNQLWHQAKEKKTWKTKKASDWDKKAVSFAKRTATSIYTKEFLKLLDPQPTWSVLDVGCGPGTIALPLSKEVNKVSCLDFSEKMLTILRDKTKEEKIKNIKTYHASWEDDWQQLKIPVHDIAISSRSLAVNDLKKAIEKLIAHARKLVVITDRVKHGPMDLDAFAAIGRPLESGPDFTYTVNILFDMGFLPTVNYITLEKNLRYRDHQDALNSYIWMFKNLDKNEEKLLIDYIDTISITNNDGTVTVNRPQPPIWAFISWCPSQRTGDRG